MLNGPCLHHLECSTVESGRGGESGSVQASICLIVAVVLSWRPGDSATPPLACRTLGLGKRLLVGMLLGVNLVVQEVCSQFISIVDLHLQRASGVSKFTCKLQQED